MNNQTYYERGVFAAERDGAAWDAHLAIRAVLDGEDEAEVTEALALFHEVAEAYPADVRAVFEQYPFNDVRNGAALREAFRDELAGKPAELPGATNHKRRAKGATVHEFARRLGDGRNYLVKGLLERRSYAVMYGEPGAGKSFLALDIAYHVAAGKPWREHRVIGGPVLYLAFEGTGGMPKRAAALERHYGSLQGVPLVIEPADWNLLDSAERKAFAARVAEIMAQDFGGRHPVLIVVDTLARAFRGDENSAQDIGAFNATIGDLIERTGACGLVIHHSGKDRSKGARGSSALLGAIDTELEVAGSQLKATKQRDVDLGAPVPFELRPVLLGEDADGDEMRSCVVVPAPGGAGKAWRPTGQAAHAWGALCELSPANEPIPESEWQAAFERRAWRVDPPAEKSRRVAFRRAVEALGEHVVNAAPGLWARAMVGGE